MASANSRDNKWPLLTVVLILIAIAITWRGCWYATPLSDAQLDAILEKRGPDNQLQKALYQIKERGERDDPDVARFYPQVIALGHHETQQIRSTVAWVMGGAREYAPFRTPLHEMLADEALLVRYNAALALANHGDAAVRPVLKEMLEPHVVRSPVAGEVESLLARGDDARLRVTVARVRDANGSIHDIYAPLGGRILKADAKTGGAVAKDGVLLEIAPTEDRILNALAALGLVGTPEDVPAVRAVADSATGSGTSVALARQTLLMMEAR